MLEMPNSPIQFPAPGTRRLLHPSVPLTFRLEVPHAPAGNAFLRTTAGKISDYCREIIDRVEHHSPTPVLHWRDLPMTEVSPGKYEITLREELVGIYEARAYFEPEHSNKLLWPEAQGNVHVKIEPAWTSHGLGIYAAHARLFGDDLPDKIPDFTELDAKGYTVIPPSGKLRAVKKQLDHIMNDLGFSIVLLLPVFPTPTTWAKMGRFGSPFAALDFYMVDPALAEFDQATTPLNQLQEVIDGVHARGGRLFIDVPINHTGWASRLLTLHPEWYHRKANGDFKSPGAWGTVWEDLVELNYDSTDLWQEMAAVLLHWCRQGIDGFRCDAGYMIPTPVWEYVITKVRQEFPETVFLLEGLGGPMEKTEELLSSGGLNWAYSELFQNYDRASIHWYLPQAISQSQTRGLQVNFAETHDNARLASQGKVWARMRTALSALTSTNGAWGITCGVEWYAQEKIAVHGMTSMNWGAKETMIPLLRRLTDLLKTHGAFRPDVTLKLITTGTGETLAMVRGEEKKETALLVLANLDPLHSTEVRWLRLESPFVVGIMPVLFDSESLLTEISIRSDGAENVAELLPGQVICIGHAPVVAEPKFPEPATGLVSEWLWPRDKRREVVWLEGTPLVLRARIPFNVNVVQNGKVLYQHRSDVTSNGLSEVSCEEAKVLSGDIELQLCVHEPDNSIRFSAKVMRAAGLPEAQLSVKPKFNTSAVLTNKHGAMCQVRGPWGHVQSQYDTLFGANLHSEVPVDRRMLLGRLRVWINRRGYSTPLTWDLVEKFSFVTPGQAVWDFRVPCGDEFYLRLRVVLSLAADVNQISMQFTRLDPEGTAAPEQVMLIVRPDMEDRGFHEKSQFAPQSAAAFEDTIHHQVDGLTRDREDGTLFHLWLPHSEWHAAPEVVGIGHAVDAERGQKGGAELYSPGWFDVPFAPNTSLELQAAVAERTRPAPLVAKAVEIVESASLAETARHSLRQFIVKRDDALTIIAGYPWFLDWGRDTLICLRGAIAAGWFEETRAILKTFAKFEKGGTLPNMIRGEDDNNRETVDAPLYFFVVVKELMDAEGNESFLKEKLGPRTMLEILRSIAENYISGTSNGIGVDPESGLVFSPSHYTWMDTNHPAGTPRQGYPICVQAKWHAALRLLARVDSLHAAKWTVLADQVRASVEKLFVLSDKGWLSDCLHASKGQSAASAAADDHLRPNQILAVTLGLITAPEIQKAIVNACGELIVPGGLRTLADREVAFALRVERDGHLLNHPHEPFWPYYSGDEDTRRKPAYHNGTAWPWLMPMLAEAMLIVYGPTAKPAATALLGTSAKLFNDYALGNISEIQDAATPHTQKGCLAQAWSVSELVRVLAK